MSKGDSEKEVVDFYKKIGLPSIHWSGKFDSGKGLTIYLNHEYPRSRVIEKVNRHNFKGLPVRVEVDSGKYLKYIQWPKQTKFPEEENIPEPKKPRDPNQSFLEQMGLREFLTLEELKRDKGVSCAAPKIEEILGNGLCNYCFVGHPHQTSKILIASAHEFFKKGYSVGQANASQFKEAYSRAGKKSALAKKLKTSENIAWPSLGLLYGKDVILIHSVSGLNSKGTQDKFTELINANPSARYLFSFNEASNLSAKNFFYGLEVGNSKDKVHESPTLADLLKGSEVIDISRLRELDYQRLMRESHNQRPLLENEFKAYLDKASKAIGFEPGNILLPSTSDEHASRKIFLYCLDKFINASPAEIQSNFRLGPEEYSSIISQIEEGLNGVNKRELRKRIKSIGKAMKKT